MRSKKMRCSGHWWDLQFFFSFSQGFKSAAWGPNLARCFFFFNQKNVIIYFWMCWVFLLCRLFSICNERGWGVCCFSLWYASFSLEWLFLLQSTGSRAGRLQQLWLLGSRMQAQPLWLPGLVTLPRVGSSQSRGGSCVSWVSRQVLYHWSAREALDHCFLLDSLHARNRFYIFKWLETKARER